MYSNKTYKLKLPSGVVTPIRPNQNAFYYYITWAEEMNKRNEPETEKLIMALIGRPTAPLYEPIRDANNFYWNTIKMGKAIEYTDAGRGNIEHRERIANAFSNEYATQIDKENVIFTVGGKSALNAWSHLFKTLQPNKKLVIAIPYYPDHLNLSDLGLKIKNIIFINTLEDSNDYKLTAKKLELALSGTNPSDVGGFVFCDPSNPMGYSIGEFEWRKIIKVLLKYETAMILLDEAYSEMVFNEPHFSLLRIAPDALKKQIVLLRSATKGLSAAGERMAVIIAFQHEFVEVIAQFNDNNIIHSPISSQFAYSYAMERLTVEEKLNLAEFYHGFVVDVQKLLKQTGFHFKSDTYQISSTFYVVADFKSLFGLPLDERASKVFLNERACIESDVDVAYHLLFKYKVAFCPMSFFGAAPDLGLLRITCSFVGDEFETLEERIRMIRSDVDVYKQNSGFKRKISSLLAREVELNEI